MKKCLLIALTVLGFTSFSYAAPKVTNFVCKGDDQINWVSASLILGTQWGTVAYLGDNYDSARQLNQSPENGYGMTCKKAGKSIECAGNWAVNKEPAKVVFTKDAAGNVSATFARSPFYGGETVTLACHLQAPMPRN